MVRHIDLEKNSLREGVKKSTGSMEVWVWGIRGGGDLHLSSGYSYTLNKCIIWQHVYRQFVERKKNIHRKNQILGRLFTNR